MEDLTQKSNDQLNALAQWITGEFNINPFASQEMLLKKERILNEFQRRGRAEDFYEIFNSGFRGGIL